MATSGEDITVKMRSKKITIKKFVRTEEQPRPIKFPYFQRSTSERKGFLQSIRTIKRPQPEDNFWGYDLEGDTSNSKLDFDPFDPKPKTDEDIVRRTSTPIKTPKRLSLFHPLSRLSPILPQGSYHLDSNFGINSRTSKGKFGNPLLSSTKLDEREDNDRLTNAPRLYQSRLSVDLSDTQKDFVTSKILHKNALFDTLLEEGENE